MHGRSKETTTKVEQMNVSVQNAEQVKHLKGILADTTSSVAHIYPPPRLSTVWSSCNIKGVRAQSGLFSFY